MEPQRAAHGDNGHPADRQWSAACRVDAAGAGKGVVFGLVLCSPMLRARETCVLDVEVGPEKVEYRLLKGVTAL